MRVSRDFIDWYSPEASHPRHRARQCAVLPTFRRRVWSDNVSFRFQVDARSRDGVVPKIRLFLNCGKDASSAPPHGGIGVFLTPCLPASLIIASSPWDLRGIPRPLGRRDRVLPVVTAES